MENICMGFGNLTLEQVSSLMSFIEEASELQLGVTFSNNEIGGLYYNTITESINIPLNTSIFDDKIGKTYQDFIKENFHTAIPFKDLIAIAILHEIGHFMTEDEDLLTARHAKEGVILYMLENGRYTEEQANKAYFGLPSEYQATEWAVTFYNYNKKMCQKLANIL